MWARSYLWPDLRCPVYATPFTAHFLTLKLKEENLEREVPLHIVPLGGRVDIGPFNVEFISLTHSIPEPNALAIRTPLGTVIHSGDWKFDPEPLVGENANTRRLKEIGDEGVLACISDSTNILNPGHSGSEGEVRRSLTELVSRQTGRVAVACFASNLARVETAIHAARTNGRQVALVGRSLWRITETARATGHLGDVGTLHEADDVEHLPADKVLYICTGSQGEPRAALNRIAWNNHPSVKLGSGDVCIFSSRIIPGNDKSILRLQNQLIRNGVQVITDHDHFIHVSGHPAQQEVAEFYRLIRPRVVIPMHGEARHMRIHADFALAQGIEHSQVVENGQVIDLSAEDGPHFVGSAPTGRLAVEGDRIVPLDSPVFKDRRRLVQHGAAVATVVLDTHNRLAVDPLVSLHGLFNPGDDEDEEIDALVLAIRHAVDRLPARDRRDDDTVRETVRRVVRRTIHQDQGRKPLTEVHLVRL